MHLYTYERAPNPQRLKHFLAHKNITLATTSFDLAKGEHFNEQFKAVNPDCTVPTLVVNDDVVLTDTIAICVFLERKYPENPLLGITDIEQAQVIGWCHKLFLEGFMSVAEVLRNKSEAFKGRALPGRVAIAQVPALIERGNHRLSAFWPQMDEHLQNKDYIVGDTLTLADIDLFVVCSFAGWIKASIPEDCNALRQWYQRIDKQLNG
ncbi:glutathione S-transferase family protein [Thalassotalea atypica]|uniref:glutathione S-transferase family protein n=1 Tax=Thalassotalea atypica TaxID=2054316 RepID=UPI0025731696|nr:glutathione S-transferase family protein [Thalassotalea atypica]